MLNKETLRFKELQTYTADGFDGDPYLPFNVKYNEKVSIILTVKGSGTTGTAKVQIETCATGAATSGTAIAFKYGLITAGATGEKDSIADLTTAVAADGFTTTAASDKRYYIEVDAQVAESPFLALSLTEVVNDPTPAYAEAIITGQRYSQ